MLAEQVQDNAVSRIERLTGRIGAIIHGVRLGGDLAPETVQDIRDALHAHKVIFFRGQDHLDGAQQEAFGELLGVPASHPLVASPEGSKAIFQLDSETGLRVNGWHTDITFQKEIAYCSILRAVELPSVGGDTLWANTAAAYRTMPDALRGFLDHAWALHSTEARGAPESPDGHYVTKTENLRECEHPLVHVVPETGEPAILMGFFYRAVVGMNHADSMRIYELVQSHVTRPENVVRWRWQPGDVAIWDNRSTQHYAVNDYDERRIMHRVSIKGTAPVPLYPRS